jgi:hypothetical protein
VDFRLYSITQKGLDDIEENIEENEYIARLS